MHRRVVFLAVLVAAVLLAAVGHADRFRDLRDEGIRNIGWVAGNSYGHSIWPQVKDYVGEGGDYYKAFVYLAPSGSDHEVEAFQNVRLYREWFEKGRSQPFNENDNMSRIARCLQLLPEVLQEAQEAGHD